MANISSPHKRIPYRLWGTLVTPYLTRHLPAFLAVCLGCALSVAGFLETRAYFATEAELEFQTLAAERSAILGRAIDRDLSILRSISGLYAASDRVDRDEFRVFAGHVYPQASGVRALEWVPRVPAAARAEYEERARAEGYPDFRINETDAGGNMVPAAIRDEHFPVYYIEPLQGNERAFGFDLGSNPARMAALQIAMETGQIAVTGSIQLVQDTERQSGFLAFAPIYRTDAIPETLEGRRSELDGFALGVFGVADIVSAVLQLDAAPAPFDIYLFDVSADPGERLLLFEPSEFAEANGEPLREDQITEGIYYSAPLFVGDRQWSLYITPALGLVGTIELVEELAVLCIGLLLTFFLAHYLVASGNRAAVVEGLVEEQTADLVAANARLTKEIAERIRFETDLARSNAELEQFASVASHDLQEPLRKIQAFADRLTLKHADRLDDQGRDYLSRMAQATARMQTLINDLLCLSRVTTAGRDFGTTDLNDAMRDVLADLEVTIKEAGGTVVNDTLPEIQADPVQMRQLFQNLIGNSLKYCRPDLPPVVRIEAEMIEPDADRKPVAVGPICQIRISDNGIGFEQEYAGRIFGMFQRLHGRGVYDGAGIGLAICLRIVERHGGRIRAEGQTGEGATITIELPGGAIKPGARAK